MPTHAQEGSPMGYEKFVDTVRPALLWLNSSSCALDRSTYWTVDGDKRRVLSSNYTVAKVGKDFFDVEATFHLALQLTKEDGVVSHALKIDCVFAGHFHTKGKADEAFAQKFADEDCWIMFWPFFRQFVVDTTARMSIPPIVVPFVMSPGQFSHEVDDGDKKPRRRTVRARRVAAIDAKDS